MKPKLQPGLSIKETVKTWDNIDLPENQKKSIAELMELKICYDLALVVSRLEARMDILNNKFESLRWIIGAAFAIAIIVIGILK